MEIVENFNQYHKKMNAERKDKLFNLFSTSGEYPKQLKKLARQNNELKDYLQYIKEGGAETPELMKDICSRASNNSLNKIEKRTRP